MYIEERIGKLRTPQIIFPGCVQKSNEPVHKFPTEIISNFSSEIYAKRKQILFPSGTKRKHLTKGAVIILNIYIYISARIGQLWMCIVGLLVLYKRRKRRYIK